MINSLPSETVRITILNDLSEPEKKFIAEAIYMRINRESKKL